MRTNAMATNLSSSFNPWSADGSVAGMQLGDPESGLVIARRHGLVSNNEDTEIGSSARNSSSIKMMDTLQDISAISSEIHKIEIELNKRFTDKEMADLVHLGVLKTRLSKMSLLLEHFTSVVTNKEAIVSRLQSQAADNSLVIETSYQRHTAEVLTSLGVFVSHFSGNCDKAKWACLLDMETTSLSKKVSETAQSIVECTSDLQTSQQLHETLEGN
ncbi:uncharacterized protein LOC135350910 isoform X1 [Halichondria panicea]|uniref:uncharacterized protein LOC135350910 isoform X1 n=1 Tax=Halichondria panicea TaxID=6063 RepID=UPI00312B2C7F